MTDSSQSKIKEQKEQSKFYRHFISEKIRTLMLHKHRNVKLLFQSEINTEETRKYMLEMTTTIKV